ncbi:nesprin-3 [Xyrichtys novacula]|uniref:Nesprin-3 n=1 Tax=Xyrichtys novacula TaxID=13765 RepID=A0AAV1GMN3_XYRNO|nr:nesprin-3 [Xyrichtys novacula]
MKTELPPFRTGHDTAGAAGVHGEPGGGPVLDDGHPREARLRETEKIHQSEHEGRVKIDMTLVAAENLLQSEDEELRNQTQAKLKNLKSLWEETCTYIIHCHSRIEWVWLHWGEYLKAFEEFELWLMKQHCSLEVGVELQLGKMEKLWQVDQQRVIVSDIHGQAVLLERLLDEAAALHNRTQDPSVDPQTQERLQEAYSDVRDRAEERLSLLQKIAEEHQTYQGCVQRFQSWLLSKTKELTDLMEREDTAENKLQALQALDDGVAGEEKTLHHIEGLAESVRGNTSPAGAEVVLEEAEELRLGWQRLRQGLYEAEDGLRSSLDSHSQYLTRCQRLGEDIGRLRGLLQGLDQELEEGREPGDCSDHTEEQMVGQWRKYTGVRNALAGEESQVELLKAQLKELFRFSEDSRHLSDDVLAVVKEHQSVKCRATRLCSESESGLRNILQDPLLVYSQWSLVVSQVLEASAGVTDFSHIAMLVQNIERLLKDSMQLQERFRQLQVKGDLLDSVFGPERADGLQDELGAAVRNRELLHNQLQQRKSRLQGLISRTKDFGDAYELIHSKLSALRDRQPEGGLQPDILAKKSQSDQFRAILKDLEDSEAHIAALETLVSSSQNNKNLFDRLYADWIHLHKVVRARFHESEESIRDHESFHDSLLNMEKWLMIMKQKLESFHSPSEGWSIEGRQHEAMRVLGEFPEKELQLQQMEAQGQGVLRRTSEEGQVHIIRDIKRLRESWLALSNMSLNLHRLLNDSLEHTESYSWKVKGLFPHSISMKTELILGEEHGQGGAGGTRIQIQTAPAEVSGVLSSSRVKGGQEGEAGGGVLKQGGCVQGHGEWGLLLTGQDREQLIGDEADSLGWSLPSIAIQRAAATESDQPAGGNSSILTADRGGEASISIQGGGVSAGGDASMNAEEIQRGAAGGAGGAFMLFMRDQAKKSSPAVQQNTETNGQHSTRRKEFEAWLSTQSELLSGILSTKMAKLNAKELQGRQDTLKGLRAGLGWGQEQFQLLLQESQRGQSGSGPAEDVGLEELRYHWMLHKSKLKDMGDIRARTGTKKPGLCHRVCRLALPLWLLLLALLLLAFLLPLMDEGNSCSLSNNFARSFNIMLRYDGPPPT